ncbi:MAG TPA: gliding motility-associated C-terminal domain-containing protein [Chitinophagaceae bacterium]
MMNRFLLMVLLLLWMAGADGQICNGSLGDPIVNISFGSGPNPGAPLSAATTSYQYLSSDCPNDGYYTITNSTSNCFGNTWHSITDHTGNANGYFMLVNASLQPSAFYLDTVKGLCGNTTYEFAAWILNILKPSSCSGAGIRPNLTFRIERTDGTVVQSYNTNEIPATDAPQWKQYGFFFTSPASASEVVLRIVNNSQGGCGNDLALDDITFRPCGPQIHASIDGSVSITDSTCEGTPRTFSFSGNISSGFNSPVMQWQQSFNGSSWTDIPGATGSGYTRSFPANAAAGNYAFRLAGAEAGNIGSSQCRVSSSPVFINVHANPLPEAVSNSPVCEGKELRLSATANNGSWSGPNGFVAAGTNIVIPDAQLSHTGKYYFAALNGSCSRNDSSDVLVKKKPLVSADKSNIRLCEGDTAAVVVTGADSYSWSPAQGMALAEQGMLNVYSSDTTDYLVIGNQGGCTDSVNVLVNVVDKPGAEAGADRHVSEGNTVQLSGVAWGDNIEYFWTPDYRISGIQSLNPVVSPLLDTSYVLHVVSNEGCGSATDSLRVHVFKNVKVPNAFSPNGDGINDRWMLRGIETYPGATVKVFDRFGRGVFESNGFSYWDGSFQGKPLPVGTYYYVIRLRGEFPLLKGWVVIL